MGWLLDGLKAIILEAINAVLAGLGALLKALFDSWPIGMPSLPDIPSGVLTAIGWIKWSPIPVAAILALFTFCVSVWVAWLLARPVMRWLKVDASD